MHKMLQIFYIIWRGFNRL